MKKGSFFICNRKGYGSDAKVNAERVTGYIDGDIGVHKANREWVATHVPTGLKIITANTRQEAIELARQKRSAPGFESAVILAKKSKYFKMFETAKNNANENN